MFESGLITNNIQQDPLYWWTIASLTREENMEKLVVELSLGLSSSGHGQCGKEKEGGYLSRKGIVGPEF